MNRTAATTSGSTGSRSPAPSPSARPRSPGTSGKPACAIAGATASAIENALRDERGRHAQQDVRRLGPRHAAGRRRQLVRRADVRRLVELEDRRGRRVSAAVRGGVGVRGARRHDDGVSVGRQARSQLRQLRRAGPGPRRQGRRSRPVGRPDGAGRVVSGERVRPARHARQRLRVGRGLLRSRPRARAGRRLGQQAGQLRQPRVPRRHVPEQSRTCSARRAAARRIRPRGAGATISASASPRR